MCDGVCERACVFVCQHIAPPPHPTPLTTLTHVQGGEVIKNKLPLSSQVLTKDKETSVKTNSLKWELQRNSFAHLIFPPGAFGRAAVAECKTNYINKTQAKLFKHSFMTWKL